MFLHTHANIHVHLVIIRYFGLAQCIDLSWLQMVGIYIICVEHNKQKLNIGYQHTCTYKLGSHVEETNKMYNVMYISGGICFAR